MIDKVWESPVIVLYEVAVQSDRNPASDVSDISQYYIEAAATAFKRPEKIVDVIRPVQSYAGLFQTERLKPLYSLFRKKRAVCHKVELQLKPPVFCKRIQFFRDTYEKLPA